MLPVPAREPRLECDPFEACLECWTRPLLAVEDGCRAASPGYAGAEGCLLMAGGTADFVAAISCRDGGRFSASAAVASEAAAANGASVVLADVAESGRLGMVFDATLGMGGGAIPAGPRLDGIAATPAGAVAAWLMVGRLAAICDIAHRHSSSY